MTAARIRFLFVALRLATAVGVHAQAPASWKLVPLHKVQPAENTPGTIGTVTGLALLPDGSMYTAESKPARVALYNNKGEFVRTMMRQGDGPGEVRAPEIASSGDTLISYDPHHIRLTRMTVGGRIIDERVIDARAFGHVWPLNTGAVVLDLDRVPPWDGLAQIIPRTGRIDTVRWYHPQTEDLAFLWKGPSWDLLGYIPYSPLGIATFDRAGHLVIGGSRRSQWFVISGKDTVQTVTLPDHPVKIPTAVRDSVWAAYYTGLPAKSLPHLEDVVRKEKIPTTLPPWISFDIDPAGNWWVGRPGPNGRLIAWDIVVNGKIVSRVPAPKGVVPKWPHGPLLGVNGTQVALLLEDEDGTPSIGVYRVAELATLRKR